MMNTMDEKEIVKEAESWLRTPWKHNVSLKGWGTDCIQFIVSLYKTYGWLNNDFETGIYTRDWALHNSRSLLLEGLDKVCVKKELSERIIGDIITFTYGKTVSHVGMYIGNDEVIHVHIRQGVTKTNLDRLTDKLTSVWRIKS